MQPKNRLRILLPNPFGGSFPDERQIGLTRLFPLSSLLKVRLVSINFKCGFDSERAKMMTVRCSSSHSKASPVQELKLLHDRSRSLVIHHFAPLFYVVHEHPLN